MDTYSLLREIADSWVMLAMFAFFIGVGIWAFLPSQASAREDASMIPFRNENPKCVKACPDCACKGVKKTTEAHIHGQ